MKKVLGRRISSLLVFVFEEVEWGGNKELGIIKIITLGG